MVRLLSISWWRWWFLHCSTRWFMNQILHLLLLHFNLVLYYMALNIVVTTCSGEGLLSVRRQAITGTNVDLLSIKPEWGYFNKIPLKFKSFKKIHLKVSTAKCRPFCTGFNAVIGVSMIKMDDRGRSKDDRETPDSKVHGANLGPTWGRQDPAGPHAGPMNFAI